MKRVQFNSIQYLRGFASLAVVLQHAMAHVVYMAAKNNMVIDLGPFNALLNMGNAGVDLFFVISGFVMAASTENSRGGAAEASKFIRKRGIRIFPMFWVFLTAYLLLGVLSKIYSPGAMETEKNFSPEYLLSSYILLPSYNGDLLAPYLGVGWSLYFELYFYTAIAFILLCGINLRWQMLILAFALTSLFGASYAVHNPVTFIATSPLVLEFLFGWVAFLLVHSRFKKWNSRRGSFGLVISGILIFIVSVFTYDYLGIYDGFRVLWWGGASFLIVLGVTSREEMGGGFESRYLLLLGAASYSMYLSHKAITLPVLNKIFGYGHFSIQFGVVWFLVLVVASVAIGIFSYSMIESPIQKRLARFSK